jgi:hypothetical protein
MILGLIGNDYVLLNRWMWFVVGILDRLPWVETNRVVSYGYEIFGASRFSCVYEFGFLVIN